jgi:hypothetical protein
VGTEIHLDVKAGPPGSRFWMVPGKEKEPRWILPHEQKYGWPFLKQWRPYDFCSRIKWQCLMIAYRGKRLDSVPGVVPLRIIVPEGGNWDHLGWPLVKPPVLVIYIGTPGPNRKAVLGLIDSEKNKIVSISKVPLGPTAGLAICHEVDILDRLALEKSGRAPRAIFIDRKNGIATQEFVVGSLTSRRLTKRHVNYLVDLAIPGETISLHEVVQCLRQKIKTQEHLNPEARAILERVLTEVDDPSPLPAVWEHGDFVPWNIKTVTNRSLQAIDWEGASRKGLPLFDLVYFYSKQAFLFGEKELFSKSFGVVLREYVERLGIAPVMTKKIILACRARNWLRCPETERNPSWANFLLSKLRNRLQGDE